MSKLIIEMEMPKRCAECGLRLKCKRYLYNFAYSNSAEYLKPLIGDKDCLIKGVLPEEHGDLIDRDELLKECYPDDEFDAHVIYADDIHKAKAVIAAERIDDGKEN